MIKKFCKWYLKNEYINEINTKVNQKIKEMLDTENEVFELNDKVYFYYIFSTAPFITQSGYQWGYIKEVKVDINNNGVNKTYYIDVQSVKFSLNFSLGESRISKSKIGLRKKTLNGDTFYPITDDDIYKEKH